MPENEAYRSPMDELAERVARKLPAAQAEQPSFWKAINSPFVITVLGGLLTLVVSTIWQERSNNARGERESQQREFEYRKGLMREFANELPQTIVIAREFKVRELWISRHAGSRTEDERATLRYVDGKSLEETEEAYNQYLQSYLARKSALGLAVEVCAAFKESGVCSETGALSDAMRKLIMASGNGAENEVDEAVGRVNAIYERVLALMAGEINRSSGGKSA